MAAVEFPGPGFSAEQWEQIKTLAVSIKPGQALWISGYFAGIDHAARGLGAADGYAPLPLATTAEPAAAAQRTLTILHGGETGNSAGLAKSLGEVLLKRGVESVVVDMANYKIRRLKDEQDLVIVTSTHGEGDPPLSGMEFFEFVEGRKAPRLPGLRYAVLALGDSTDEHFCAAGKRLDLRLAELGAARLGDRIDCDVDYDEAVAAWIETLAGKLEPARSPGTAHVSNPSPLTVAASGAAVFDRRNPFTATIIDNYALTGRGSSKETRHVEISLEGSNVDYEPGDALGIVPRNDPTLVDRLTDTLSLSADTAVERKGGATTLGEALASGLEISALTPRFVEHWAALSGSAELAALVGEGRAEARAAFFRTHHVIDVVRRFPVGGIDAQSFVAVLRPLQPRLYSLASSLANAPGEAHLTVSAVRYDLNGEPRLGVASGQIAERGEPDTKLPVYVQPNPHFRLPEDDVPIIMIGAGTGVAPYRSFLQEREARGAAGRSWLFFGERNFLSDFLYQTEWQTYLKDGVLRRMNVAFSRDQEKKIYVQHKLFDEARDLYAWLEEGAHLYLCGDGAHLAPDVQAALARVVEHGRNCSPEDAEEYLAALRRDHRYHIDVY